MGGIRQNAQALMNEFIASCAGPGRTHVGGLDTGKAAEF